MAGSGSALHHSPPPTPKSLGELAFEHYNIPMECLDANDPNLPPGCFRIKDVEREESWLQEVGTVGKSCIKRSREPSTQDFFKEQEEMLKRIEKNERVIEKFCSRLTQERLFNIKNEAKKEAVEEEGVSRVDKQVDLEDPSIEELACKTIIAPNHQEEKTKEEIIDEVVRKEGETEEEEDLGTQHGEDSSQEGEEFEDAIGFQPVDKVEVDEASTNYVNYSNFPSDLDTLLEKDPFVVSLSQDKATTSSIPLGGSGDDTSRMLDWV
ncbi:unnamed protein product [Linum trigynum]|uniref:Uncharacterized protein n=1 Tax=Linum trigynum TaxID=586398 RepID=A0AAV2DX17_9ROSI